MTLLRAFGKPVPKITKQYRPLHHTDDRATYVTVTAEGSELVIFKPGEFPFTSFIGGVRMDCAMGLAECAWPECPQRNRPVPDLESKDAEVDAPFRVLPSSPQDVQETPAPVEPAPVPVQEHEAPPAPDYVQRAAKALALGSTLIFSTGPAN
jgi:hypothetical protein